jgi:hypothetical protein
MIAVQLMQGAFKGSLFEGSKEALLRVLPILL